MYDSTSQSSQSASASRRVFYNIPEKPFSTEDTDISPQEPAFKDLTSITYYTSFFSYIESNIVGRDVTFNGPFGTRPIVYCDYTASGRSLKFIEEFIYNEVLPEYANTHTTNTATSLQTTMFRHEARDIIRTICKASSDDVVLFIGSGCTGAVHKLIHNLNLLKPPVIFVGPFEHHSNLLPWRHLAYSIHRINIKEDGSLNLEHLEKLLIEQTKISKADSRPFIGVFAAVSNVTGIISNVNLISSLMHRYHGLVFWDYAAGAPYLPIDMNPIVTGPDRDFVYKDAVYFSIHKFIGGVQTPGVLIAKKLLFIGGEEYPDGTGGGTVFFVRRNNQIYLKDVEEREEGGTPDIVGAIRAGLVFKLKETATTDAIIKRENYLVKISWSKFSLASSNLIILGGSKTHRLPIFSFLIRQEIRKNEYLYLHHNFVCALLNDLFGIQSRSGCACAGPYAMDLIGIDELLAKRFEDALVGIGMTSSVLTKYFESPHREIFRPGFVRINFPYFMPDAEVNYVIEAISFVAKHGYKFLPYYNFNAVTSEWRYKHFEMFKDKKWLGHVSFRRGYMTWRRPQIKVKELFSLGFVKIMESVHKKMLEITNTPIDMEDESFNVDESIHNLRWFLLPSEAATLMWNTPRVAKPSYALFVPGSIAQIFCGQEENTNNINTAELVTEITEVAENFKEIIERTRKGNDR